MVNKLVGLLYRIKNERYVHTCGMMPATACQHRLLRLLTAQLRSQQHQQPWCCIATMTRHPVALSTNSITSICCQWWCQGS